jgi:hypothetical protein
VQYRHGYRIVRTNIKLRPVKRRSYSDKESSRVTVKLYIESDNSSGDCYRIAIDFASEDAENSTLLRMFQHVPGSLLAQSQQTNSSRPYQQSQYHTQSNVFLSKQELNNWTKGSYKRG